ncbi:MAG: hypothetical protein K6F05_07195 [Succinivibrio sp.]|nr:hypothetical protein [Succinivibrio sp.]
MTEKIGMGPGSVLPEFKNAEFNDKANIENHNGQNVELAHAKKSSSSLGTLFRIAFSGVIFGIANTLLEIVKNFNKNTKQNKPLNFENNGLITEPKVLNNKKESLNNKVINDNNIIQDKHESINSNQDIAGKEMEGNNPEIFVDKDDEYLNDDGVFNINTYLAKTGNVKEEVVYTNENGTKIGEHLKAKEQPTKKQLYKKTHDKNAPNPNDYRKDKSKKMHFKNAEEKAEFLKKLNDEWHKPKSLNEQKKGI